MAARPARGEMAVVATAVTVVDTTGVVLTGDYPPFLCRRPHGVP